MYLTTTKFAAMQGVSYGRIYALLKEGLPHQRLQGGTVVIPVEDAVRWRAERRLRIGAPKKKVAAA